MQLQKAHGIQCWFFLHPMSYCHLRDKVLLLLFLPIATSYPFSSPSPSSSSSSSSSSHLFIFIFLLFFFLNFFNEGESSFYPNLKLKSMYSMEESAVLFNIIIIYLLKHACSSFFKCRCQEILINDDKPNNPWKEKKQKRKVAQPWEMIKTQNPNNCKKKKKEVGGEFLLLVLMLQNLTEDQKPKSQLNNPK